ncbi:hypothetical protein [Vibrio phage JSF12]|uniref:Peptidase M15A C-terminal domain-containing protein n=2 Tax=Jesfedecavirus TaxID=2560156 RepID=A0A2D0YX14_9CAUD|nr:endolysin [Vibrio phage JSF10]YP_009794739.1 endolysin [Vibrio phage JSF12]ASV43374.1 hypothetical protein [Vibrio phage JSF10]ASV43574.1 hypothetical protein [Vibrio phage JSF12]
MSNLWNRGFSRKEFACKCGCGYSTVDAELLEVLVTLKEHFNGATVKIASGCRCEEHNKKVGGRPRKPGERYSGSKHLWGVAADIQVSGVAPSKVADYLEKTYPNKYGIGRYDTFTHIDIESSAPRRW